MDRRCPVTLILMTVLWLLPFCMSAEDYTGSFGSIDKRYERKTLPVIKVTRSWKGSAWRGERVNAQIILWSISGARGVRARIGSWRTEDGTSLSQGTVQASFVRYVKTDDGSHGCKKTDFSTPPRLVADILDPAPSTDIPPNSVQPLWISIDVPVEALPGQYSGRISLRDGSGSSLDFEMELEVLPLILPPPDSWSFHLDLWQNPWSVARYHNVQPWSQGHIDRLKSLLEILSRAGQKVITTTIVRKPWGGQTYDPYDSLIRWTQQEDGSWAFDYSNFDRYVELCLEAGITRQINCYSMITWGDIYFYFSAEEGRYKSVSLSPGTPEYARHWTPFLRDFVLHLRSKGWLDRTCIAMDERPLDQMKGAIALIKTIAPELKISLAGFPHPEILPEIHDFSYNWRQIGDEVEAGIEERKASNRVTTYYVACGIPAPNNFTYSPPPEQAWLGWFAAARGFDGFLRWAYNSWVKDPIQDTRHVKFPGGDCFQVYPGPRSSIRFERLREGIQDFEKIRILRKRASAADLHELERILDRIARRKGDHNEELNAAKIILLDLSRTASESRADTAAGFEGKQIIGKWVRLWNTYDLDLVKDLFLNEDRLTYFSSEKEGAIRGLGAVIEQDGIARGVDFDEGQHAGDPFGVFVVVDTYELQPVNLHGLIAQNHHAQ